ncbi:MAG: hypothetical protein OXR66_07510 [Candidatus Woesearchaeota archaeon]|nr:hypothetical protein [Candidatus Woesearchaeota archaeon]
MPGQGTFTVTSDLRFVPVGGQGRKLQPPATVTAALGLRRNTMLPEDRILLELCVRNHRQGNVDTAETRRAVRVAQKYTVAQVEVPGVEPREFPPSNTYMPQESYVL